MRSLVTLTIAALLMLGATQAHAGSTRTYSYCTKFSDGSGGNCLGNFASFRNTGASSDFAEFYTSWDGVEMFYAYYSNVFYSCALPLDGSLDKALDRTLAATDLFFEIGWNASGVCTGLYIYKGSSDLP